MEVLQKSTIHLKDYFYTTLNGANISYRALSYKELENIQSKYQKKRNQSQIITIKTALENIKDFPLLTSQDCTILADRILTISTVSNSDMDTIKFSVAVVLDDGFKSDDFKSCKLCQEKKLDKQRNCPLLSEDTHDKGVFYIIEQKKLTVCPMDDVNSQLTSDAFRCYNFYDNGFLPESGGIMDQTMFFCEVSSLVTGIINNHQAKAMDKK